MYFSEKAVNLAKFVARRTEAVYAAKWWDLADLYERNNWAGRDEEEEALYETLLTEVKSLGFEVREDEHGYLEVWEKVFEG